MSLKTDVDRGLEIRAEMEKLTTELKDIEGRVKHAALHGEQVDLADADREGRQFLAAGTSSIVPVILTADMIIGSFAANTAKHRELSALMAGRQLTEFFKSVDKFENRFDSGKKFRLHAADVLGMDAPAFITACVARDKDGIPKSTIKIMWDETKTKI